MLLSIRDPDKISWKWVLRPWKGRVQAIVQQRRRKQRGGWTDIMHSRSMWCLINVTEGSNLHGWDVIENKLVSVNHHYRENECELCWGWRQRTQATSEYNRFKAKDKCQLLYQVLSDYISPHCSFSSMNSYIASFTTTQFNI